MRLRPDPRLRRRQPLHQDACDSETGACTSTGNAAACDDGDACTTGDVCAATTCAGTPLDCSGLDTECVAGVCTEGTCEAVEIGCGVGSLRLSIGSASLTTPATGMVRVRGTLGQGQPTGPVDPPTGIRVRLGFH